MYQRDDIRKFPARMTILEFGLTMALGIILSAIPFIVSIFRSGTQASRLTALSLAVLIVFFGAAVLRGGWFYFHTYPKGLDKHSRTKSDSNR
jgi:hypothetical protein